MAGGVLLCSSNCCPRLFAISIWRNCARPNRTSGLFRVDALLPVVPAAGLQEVVSPQQEITLTNEPSSGQCSAVELIDVLDVDSGSLITHFRAIERPCHRLTEDLFLGDVK